ncbi:MAG: TonB-dependent receptor [Betaproteobacteria bacterium]|nr:TonB-dependent receptor [Betaproteobacteria bacterium]
MFKHKLLPFAVRQAVSLGVAAMVSVGAIAQTATTEKTVVTGSNIKRVEGESANPVQIISRQEIERAGVATVNDVLQRITGAGAAADDRITNGFAPGGGSLNLRGLGFNSTLILVNGRRLPTYPFAQQFTTSQGFQDINNIPLAAVDRIEVLKDGASAIYGADAVGGVVNVILRQDYQGAEVSAGYGVSSRHDGTTKNASITAGFGSLTTDRFNILFGGNYSTREEVKSIERPWSGTEDLRNAGGSDRRSAYGYPGTIYDTVTGDPFYDAGGICGPTTQRENSSIRGGFCRYDRAKLGSLQPAADKTGAYARANVAITPAITGFAEVLFTRNKYKSSSWPAGTTDDVGIGSYLIPGGTPGNPFPNDAEAYFRFADVGNRGDKGTADTKRLVLGLKGVTAGWDWEVAGNLNRIDIDTLAINNALNTRTMCLTNPQAAASYAAGGDPLGFGTLNQIFAANPSYAAYFRSELAKCPAAFAQFGYYNYQNPAANDPGVAAYLRHDSLREGRSKLDGFDLKASRELMPMGGGALALALGFESRKESVSDVPDVQLQTGDTLSISAAQAFGSRRVSALYAELNAPFTKQLEANLALRYDKYTGNGSFAATSPKVGVRYQPNSNLLFRATASKAFRAPSLFETSPAQQTSFSFGIQDPVLCPEFNEDNPECVRDIRRVAQGNPELKPEKSTAFTLGMVIEPMRDFSIAIDGWKIDRKDEIGAFLDQTLINVFPNDGNIVVRNAAGQIIQLNQVPVQLNKTKTWGVDLEVALKTNLGAVGMLTSKFGLSYVGSYKFTTIGDDGLQTEAEFNGTYNQPRYRTSWDFALNRGPWEVSIGGYGVGGYTGLGTTEHVSPFEVWNLGVAYTGIKNLKIRAGVNNLLDKAPSFDDESSGSNAGYNPQWGDVIGRFYTLEMTYKFK